MDKNISEAAQKIIEEMHNYIRERGSNYMEWYVGIVKESHKSIFIKIVLYSHYWMYKKTGSPQIAKEVLDYFVNILGTNSDYSMPGSGDYASIVYVYKKKTYICAQKPD